MALLSRGSSIVSNSDFCSRLQREQATVGDLTVSLAWNDPSDLDLHAHVDLVDGGSAHIFFRNKKDAGGVLDVDMHANESSIVDGPVENIFWQTPPAGTYRISTNLYRKRGNKTALQFRAVLKRKSEEDISMEGKLGAGLTTAECFRFVVDGDGRVQVEEVAEPAPAALAVATKVRARLVATKAKAKAKAATVVKGKMAKVLVYKGKMTKTSSGLTKHDLTRGKHGRIVSLKKHELGKMNKWAQATSKARIAKGVSGFRLLKRGDSFYEKVKAIFAES